MAGVNFQSDLNDLIREAMSAQDGFDNWDEGVTHYPGVFDRGRRECTLDDVVKELDAANLKLVLYVLKHGLELINELKPEE